MVQWFLILTIAAAGARILFRPVPQPDRTPENWRSWDGFYALSYGSIMHGATGAEVSPELLGEHFKALREAGFNTITPDDLTRYAEGRHALPENALLLMFEGGRKDSILNVTPLLRHSGFVAVACINTGACESRDRFYLTRAELRDVARQPHWSLGSMGHQAVSHLSHDPKAQKDPHFLTSRKYENGAFEDDTAFVVRIMQDYSTSANFLSSLIGRSPVLFLYPFTDRGLGPKADPLAARVNRMAVELLYRVAFVDGHEPFNGPTRDRYALTRLRVDGRMTARALLDRLSRSKPRPRAPDSSVTSTDWNFAPKARESEVWQGVVDWPPKLELQDGMTAWIKGSEDWTDSQISTLVQLTPDAIAGVYARYVDPEQCLYLSVTTRGIRLQERSKGGSHVTLLDYKSKLEPGRSYRLRLRLKRNRAFVFLNGDQAGQPAPLTAVDSRGKCGIGSKSGTTVFSGVTGGPLPRVFIVGNQYRALPESLRQSALAFLSDLPVTENQSSASGGSVCVDAQQIDEMIAAAAEGVEPIPLVNTVRHTDSASPQPCTRISDLATLKPLVRRLGLRGIGEHKPRDLTEQRLAPVRVLQASQVRDWMSSSKDTRQEIILVEGSESDVLRAIQLLLHYVPPQRLVAGSVHAGELPPGVGIAVHSRSPE